MVSDSIIKNPETLLIINILKKDYETSIEQIKSGLLNWDSIYKKTIDCGVLNKFYANISQSEMSELIPVEVRERFEKFYHFSIARNSLLIKTFLNIHQILKHEDIEVMPIKGLGLIFKSYSDISERFTSDIDILIKQRDVSEAVGILKKKGFTPTKISKSNFWHVQFIDEYGIEIELHYNIPHGKSSPDIMGIFNNSKLHTVDGRNIAVPSSEDLLIFQARSLTLRNALGQGSIIKTCVDYMVTVEKEGDNWSWERFYARSEKFGSQNYVLFVLLFLHHIFQWGNKFQQNEFQEKLKSSILNRHIHGYDIPVWFVNDGDISFDSCVSSLYKLFISGDITEFFKHLKYALLPEKERIAERYRIYPHSMRTYFYYLVRIFELLKTKLRLRSIFNTFRVARFLDRH